MFSYKQYYPSQQLTDLIECYWVLHSPSPFIETPDRLVPGGRVEMMFSFNDPINWLIEKNVSAGISMNGVFLMGQRNRIFYAKSSGITNVLGLRFKPGGLAAFTSMPVSNLLNTIVPAELVFGKEVKGWQSFLYELPGDEDRVRALDALLLKAIKYIPADKLLMNHAIDALRNSNNDTFIATICNETGWYYKKLERLFLKNAGYTPKYYHKIIRFNKAIRLMKINDSLTDVCYECNYFDQSHFIRDFKQFAGTTPGSFKKQDNKIASFLIKHQPV